ncbi:ComEA family DNA-binding protein [Mycolicibacterium sp. CBMA 226]|uniref:ComEA family DNA-binding protein n=1 Tax=Mycolicibacterium sp. CBMA 226 TaxID=2606611 RepID=UPI0012DF581A|nr:ComEA family DNA-binding protein [Mycolicibacterium sp. CBMA 226]MUL79310.1 ComEA family DNA-binding protein [Mycolicibacterium sp. CBMA 226]
MVTQTPVDRTQRRLTAQPGDTTEPDAESDSNDDTSLSRWLPDAVPGSPGWLASVRADPGRAGVIALAVVGVVAVLVTVIAVLGDDKPPVTAAKLPPVQMVSSATAGASAPPAKAEDVVVSVAGLVHKPGLVTLPAGARIADAVTAAGGALAGADLVGLNMARKVADGEQILVGITAPVGAAAVMRSSAGATSGPPEKGPSGDGKGSGTKGPVDLNAATEEQLDGLPGIGPVMAKAIVAWRAAHGRFASVDQLGEVDGIGPGRLEKLRELVKV